VRGDDLDAVPIEPFGGPQTPFADTEPDTAFPMPRRADRDGIPPWVFIVAGAVVVALVAFFLVTRGGNDADNTASPSSAAAVTAKLCQDVQQLQTLRSDALTRTQDDLKADAVALKQAGETAAAKKVNALVKAVGDYSDALETQQDTGPATASMQKAERALPC
jgi:hypothetical protein